VLGPDSSLAAIIAAVILPLGQGDMSRTIALAGMLAIITGVFCILAGLLRLGFITDLLSKPIRYGYLNGIALTVLVGQLPKLFGFSISADGLIKEAQAFVTGLMTGETNWVALAIGVVSLAIIFLLKRFPRFPGILVAVVVATVVVGVFNLASRAGVPVVGVLPQGLPSFTLPFVTVKDMATLVAGALTIAVASFAETSVLSRTLAANGNYYVDQNQEMVGLGTANLAAGFFLGFPISSSASRTPVAVSSGSRTQLTGVVGAAAIAMLLVFAPGLLQNLPNSALAAVVIAAAIGIFEVSDLSRLYQIERWEFWLSMVCFLGVAILGPIQGILIAIFIALGEFLWGAWRPHYAVLGRVDSLKGYHDMARYPDARRIPGLVLFRWDAPLFFANAELFRKHVLDAVADAPDPVIWLVVAAEPVTGVDITSVDMLTELDEELHRAGSEMVFAEMKDPVKDQLKRFGAFKKLGEDLFFPTIGQAIRAYLKMSKINWVDWEDQ